MASSAVAPEAVASGQNTDGWFVDLTFTGNSVGGSYDFGLGSNNETDNAKVVFTATSSSFDASGVAGTATRTFYGTKVVRKVYPDNADLQEDDTSGDLVVRIAVSDFIYSGETVTVDVDAGFHTDLTNGANTAVIDLAVTNNSTLSYPKTIARWATVPYQRVDEDFLIEVVAFNQFAKNGKPVACVKFEVEDQSGNSVTHTANKASVSTLDMGDGSSDAVDIWTYAYTVPVATLADGDVLTCNFEAFPHIGDSSSTRDSRTTGDGVSPANENLGPLPMLNDKGDTARRYAHVDPNTGTNGSQGVFTSESAALASPYSTIQAASAAFSTSDIAVITLSADNHNWTKVSAGNANTWTVIKPASGTPTIFGAANSASSNVKLAIHGCSLNDNGAVGQLRGNVSSSYLWIHNAPNISQTGLAAIYQWVSQYCTRCQSATRAKFTPFASNRSPMSLARGNDFNIGNGANDFSDLGPYMCVGNTGFRFLRQTGEATNRSLPQNTICAFNRRFNAANEPCIKLDDEDSTGTDGHAYVANIVEVTASGSQPVVTIAADTTQQNCDNVILWHNVVVGQRTNYGYNDNSSGRGTRNNWSQVGNLYGSANIKTDDFGGSENALNILNWPWYHQVNCRDGGYDFEVQLNFDPDHRGIKIQKNPTVTFTDPQSFYDGGGGNGDYSIQSGFGFEAIAYQDQVLAGWQTYGAIQDISDAIQIFAYHYNTLMRAQ